MYSGMKLTFSIPDPVARRFLERVPSGRRSPLVARLLAAQLDQEQDDLVRACQQANANPALHQEMADWEALNEHED